MNKANLLRVADAIEKHEIVGLGFNMAEWLSHDYEDKSGHSCGTTACVRGHAVAVILGEIPNYFQAATLVNVESWLELNEEEATSLFINCPTSVDDMYDVTPRHTINTLRYAAEHDVVDWDAANPPEAEDVSAS